MAEELTLGTIFTGRVDESFRKAVTDLRNLLNQLHRASSVATSGVVGATRAAGTEMDNFGKKISKVSGGFQRLTAAMKVTFAYGLAYKAISGVTGALSAGVTAVFDYDQALKNLQAITTSTEAETAAMGVTIKQVASDTKYSVKEAADAAIILGQAGFSASETIASLNAVAMLSTGTLSDMTKVADLMTTAIRAFGEDASEAGRIADIFSSAVNKSKLTIDKLRTAFNYLGPIAKQSGLSLEETAAGAMLLANAGLRASTIGTGFRQVLARLVNPSQKLRLIFKATGADMDKLNPATASFKDILGELEKILGKNVDTATRSQRAFQLFGLRGAAVAAAFAQAGTVGFEKMMKEVLRVGTASAMAETQMEGLGVMAKNLKDKIELLAITIGEGGIAGAFRVLLQVLRPVVDALTYMADSAVGKIIIAITSLTSVLLLLRISLKYIIVQLSALAFGYDIATVKTMILAQGQNTLNVAWAAGVTAIKRLWAAMAAHPFIAWAAFIAALITGFATFIQHQRQAKEALEANIIKMQASIQKLEGYEEKLNDTTITGDRHRALVERLIRDYPQLASVVNLATMEFTDQGEAVKELIKQQKELRLIEVAKLLEVEYKEKTYATSRKKRWEETARQFKTEEQYQKELKKRTAASELAEGKYAITIRDTAETMRMYGLSASSSIEQVSDILVKNLQVSSKNVDEFSKSILAYYKDIENSQKTSVKTTAKAVDDQLALLKQLDKEYGLSFVKLYKSLSLSRQGELLMDLDKLQKKIEKMAEAAKTLGLSNPQIDAQIRDQYQKFFKAFVRQGSETERVMKEAFDSMAEDLLKFAGKEQEAEEKRAAIAKEARDAKIKGWDDEKKIAAALVESEKVYQAEILSIDKKYLNKRMALYSELSDIYAKNIDDREARELSESAEHFRVLRERANVEIKEKRVLTEYLVMLDDAENTERLRILAAFEEARRKEREKGEKQEDRDVLRKASLDQRNFERMIRIERDILRHRLDSLREWLKEGVISVDEYVDTLHEAYRNDLISYQEMTERKMAVEGTWLQQISFGIKRSILEFRTWGETWIEIGRNVFDELSSGITNAVIEWTDGTKTMGDAFRDMAKDVMHWLTEMLLKQILFNAMSGLFNKGTTEGYKGFSSYELHPTNIGGPLTKQYQHGGWITEPVVGIGVRSKKPYSIAEKNPEYVGSGAAAPAPNIFVNVKNETGVQAKASVQSRVDASGMVISIVLDAIERNKDNLRDRIAMVR